MSSIRFDRIVWCAVALVTACRGESYSTLESDSTDTMRQGARAADGDAPIAHLANGGSIATSTTQTSRGGAGNLGNLGSLSSGAATATSTLVGDSIQTFAPPDPVGAGNLGGNSGGDSASTGGQSSTAEPGAGGLRAAGGSPYTGGAPAMGGRTTGGSSMTGGAAPTGGAAIGGLSTVSGRATGGNRTTGGANATGGRATAGAATGGAATGGAATGGAATGGGAAAMPWCNYKSEWQGCGGPSGSVCKESIDAYPFYAKHYPACAVSSDCGGNYKVCTSSCPEPQLSDMIDYQSTSCAGVSGGWNGCRGSGCTACVELLVDYPQYFIRHPDCKPNCTCANGGFFASTCSAVCPAPTSADR